MEHSLGRRRVLCCAPFTSNSNGPDSQETCAWSSTEPQTCSETSRSCPPFPQDHRPGEGQEDKLGTYRKHHICWNRGIRGHHFNFPVPRAKHQSLRSHSWDTHSKKLPSSPASGDRSSSEASGNTTSTGPWPVTLARKKHIVALQETKNPGGRMSYKQDTHSVTS